MVPDPWAGSGKPDWEPMRNLFGPRRRTLTCAAAQVWPISACLGLDVVRPLHTHPAIPWPPAGSGSSGAAPPLAWLTSPMQGTGLRSFATIGRRFRPRSGNGRVTVGEREHRSLCRGPSFHCGLRTRETRMHAEMPIENMVHSGRLCRDIVVGHPPALLQDGARPDVNCASCHPAQDHVR